MLEKAGDKQDYDSLQISVGDDFLMMHQKFQVQTALVVCF